MSFYYTPCHWVELSIVLVYYTVISCYYIHSSFIISNTLTITLTVSMILLLLFTMLTNTPTLIISHSQNCERARLGTTWIEGPFIVFHQMFRWPKKTNRKETEKDLQETKHETSKSQNHSQVQRKSSLFRRWNRPRKTAASLWDFEQRWIRKAAVWVVWKWRYGDVWWCMVIWWLFLYHFPHQKD